MTRYSIYLVLMFGVVYVSGQMSDNQPSEEFAQKVASLVQEDPYASQLFELANVPQEEAGEVFKRVISSYLLTLGITNDNTIAKEASDAVARNWDKISPSDYALLYAYNLESALTQKGLLNQDNVENLASKAAKDASEVAKHNNLDSPDDKLNAVLDSYNEFYDQVGLDFAKVAAIVSKNWVKILDAKN